MHLLINQRKIGLDSVAQTKIFSDSEKKVSIPDLAIINMMNGKSACAWDDFYAQTCGLIHTEMLFAKITCVDVA